MTKYNYTTNDKEDVCIRIEDGDFVETVFKFNPLVVDEHEVDGEMEPFFRFSVVIMQSPDTDLTEEDPDFQQVCAEILGDILEKQGGTE